MLTKKEQTDSHAVQQVLDSAAHGHHVQGRSIACTLHLCMATAFRTDDGRLLAVPYSSFSVNIPLTIVKSLDDVTVKNKRETVKFNIDDHDGAISPAQAPGLVIGIGHEVTYAYHPHDPYSACLPCHKVALQAANKVRCLGATAAVSQPGYMLLHRPGERRLQVHACPNRDACPGSNLSLTGEGRTSSHSKLCAEGYRRSPGCVLCEHGYGRPQLDPFVCRPCGSLSLTQQAALATVSSGVFYAIALASARPKTNTQQIFKVFLSFLTISCRGLSALPFTLHFEQLKQDMYATARSLSRGFLMLNFIISAEPGAGIHSHDCWGFTDGPVNLFCDFSLTWAIPLGLLALSFCCIGWQSWLKVLLVWSNVFIPVLAGAAAKLIPCFSTQKDGDRVLMYEAPYGTPCASTMATVAKLPRFWLALGTGLVLLLLGPILWLSLVRQDGARDKTTERKETVAFLTAGYKPMLCWWEITVLSRKTAVFVVATWFPMSWAPEIHLIYLLSIVAVAELLHATVQPYDNASLNRLEARMLGVSSLCLLLVASLLARWPYRPYAVYLATLVLLLLLTAGAYVYFLCLYMYFTFTREPETDAAEEAEEAQ